MCENLYYESVYFKELHNQQELNTIDRQNTERGQLLVKLKLMHDFSDFKIVIRFT